MTPPLWQEAKRNQFFRKPLHKSESRELKSWLKTQHSKNEDHGIQSHHFMANYGETVTDFIWGGGGKIIVN